MLHDLHVIVAIVIMNIKPPNQRKRTTSMYTIRLSYCCIAWFIVVFVMGVVVAIDRFN